MFKVDSVSKQIFQSFNLPFSKSESNRALIIQAICNNAFEIKNLSNAVDTEQLAQLILSDNYELNAGEGGTTFRFLLALLAIKNEEHILSAGERMLQRPVKPLVDALNSLGANILYLEKNGFPPLKISKGDFSKSNNVKIDSGISSQFISALLLIAPCLPNGLVIELAGKLLSWPYIEMTLRMLHHFGIKSEFQFNESGNRIINVKHQHFIPSEIIISKDWSAASYFYELAVLSNEAEIVLPGLKQNSFQGDEIISEIMNDFGIRTSFNDEGAIIKKVSKPLIEKFVYDFTNHPDLAQTMAFTCAALGMEAELSGLDNLSIKETDRIQSVKNEIEKAGTRVEATSSSLKIYSNTNVDFSGVKFESYKDHRMIMSAVPLTMKFNQIFIDEIHSVSKSFPGFITEISYAGIVLNKNG